MSNAIYKYMRDGEPVYLTINDAGECIDWRGADDLSAADVIGHLVQKLTAYEIAGRVIKNQRKQITDALEIINDEATRVELSL